MKRNNAQIARLLNELADALEIPAENPFRVNAYRKAVRVLQDLPEDVSDLLAREGEKGILEIPGVGSGIAKKIVEYLQTGRIRKHDEVMARVPSGLLPLLNIQGLGPRTIHLAWKELGVTGLEDLKRVIENGELARLPGLGPKKVANILKGIESLERTGKRIPIGEAIPLVESILEALRQEAPVDQLSPAGSFRRMKETVGDLDILATSSDPARLIQTFVHLPGVTRILAAGETKGSAIFEDRYQVDLRVVDNSSYGAALQYFTGSRDHNVHLRGIARERGLKISEYGVFRGEQRVAGETEESVYSALDMLWIPPELREDRGEIEAAQEGRLPSLLELSQIKGDLHVHSRYSDGHSTLEEIAEEARRLGYAYVAVCDHSRTARYARGLEIDRLKKKLEEIRALNERLEDVTLLAGAEVDILPDGSLDYPDEILAELDYVVASIHQWRKKEDLTERILRAMDNPYIHAIAHPTGRLLTGRDPYPVDLDAVAEKAAQTGVWLEINAHAERLDLNDPHILQVRRRGVRFVLGTDAHHAQQMWMMRLGVGMARRGWLPPEEVINTCPLPELRQRLQERRKRRSSV